MLPRLFFDMDQVLADFDGDFPKLFGVDHRKIPDDQMWALINAHGSYFRSLTPLPGALELFNEYRIYNPAVLTACPHSDYAGVANQKRAWIRQHLGDDVTVLPVVGGKNKALFMHAPGDVLIDDFRPNCKAWELAGGVAILHDERDLGATRARLAELGFVPSFSMYPWMEPGG